VTLDFPTPPSPAERESASRGRAETGLSGIQFKGVLNVNQSTLLLPHSLLHLDSPALLCYALKTRLRVRGGETSLCCREGSLPTTTILTGTAGMARDEVQNKQKRAKKAEGEPV
jgi:hypothetical protein